LKSGEVSVRTEKEYLADVARDLEHGFEAVIDKVGKSRLNAVLDLGVAIAEKLQAIYEVNAGETFEVVLPKTFLGLQAEIVVEFCNRDELKLAEELFVQFLAAVDGARE